MNILLQSVGIFKDIISFEPDIMKNIVRICILYCTIFGIYYSFNGRIFERIFFSLKNRMINYIFKKYAGLNNSIPKIPKDFYFRNKIREKGLFLKYLIKEDYNHAFQITIKYCDSKSAIAILNIRPFETLLEYYIFFMLNDTKLRKEKIKAMIKVVDHNSKLRENFLLPLINYYMIGYFPFEFVEKYFPDQALFKYGETFNASRRIADLHNEISKEEINCFCERYKNNIECIGRIQEQKLLTMYSVDSLLEKIDKFIEYESK